MSIETTTIDHICSVIRREVQSEFKDLTLIFITYETGKILQGLGAKRHEIYKHTSGDAMFNHLHDLCKNGYEEDGLAALHQSLKKSLKPPFRQRQILGIYFVNIKKFKDPEHVRSWAYHQVWHALDLLQNFRANNEKAFDNADGIITPKDNAALHATTNMLGDAFCAILENFKGDAGHISRLSRRRCKEAMNQIPGHSAELYPFPIAEEATQIVYEDLRDETMQESRPMTLAADMAREVAYTFDDAAINQWRNFANRAQEMAWMGFNKNKILSTAIYTSEDPYVRSMAYLVSETLNLDPTPIGDLQTHNPFAEQEANERAHIKRAQDSFDLALEQDSPETVLKERALLHNQKLLDGHILGWCANAMLDALMPYKDLHETGTDIKSLARERFKRALPKTEWRSLLNLNRVILRLKRNQKEITPDLIIKICERNEGLDFVKTAMENAPPQTPIEDEERKEEAADDPSPAAPEIQIDESD